MVLTPNSWSITEPNDKANLNSKAIVHAKGATTFPAGEWLTLRLEVKVDEVVASIAGRESLRGKACGFHVKKPGLVFRVGGKDGQKALIENVRVGELRP